MKGSRSEDDIRIVFDDKNGYNIQSYAPDFINWQPLYDLYMVEAELVITIDLAGITTKDFSIHVTHDYLILKGVRRSPVILTKETCKFHNIEIPYGSFYRRIDFPLRVEPRQYHCSLDNGLLTLRFLIEREKIIPIEDG
jgi:HSP20 family molecular chaperone IbpA